MKPALPTFETEAALCQAFIAHIRSVAPDWIVYPETANWDILLVHRVGGWQIGVEAKLSLNAKVLVQAIDGIRRGYGPDFRAVLVGRVVAENACLANSLGLTVIAPEAVMGEVGYFARRARQGPKIPVFRPALPETESLVQIGSWWSNWDREVWYDRFPVERCGLPDYVPEVAAGVPSPMILSDWKIRAMRVCVWVERHQIITRAEFRDLGIDPSRWMNGLWLKAGAGRGEWVAGPHFPADRFRREHPSIFARIEADYSEWSQRVKARPAVADGRTEKAKGN